MHKKIKKKKLVVASLILCSGISAQAADALFSMAEGKLGIDNTIYDINLTLLK